MTKPLDPFSEVVDERRRWTPEWYTFLADTDSQISSIIGSVGGSVSQITYARAISQNNLGNGKLVETHSGNAATFTVKTLAGSDPSAVDPVIVVFPDASVLTITTALSLTIPAGWVPGTVGTSGRPFRLWFVLINDAGASRLGVVTHVRSDLTIIWGFDARGVTNAVAFDIVNNSAGLICTTVAVSSKPYRVIAFADYESGLATAGNFNVSPARITMVGSDTPMPGSVLRRNSMFTNGQLLIQTGNPTPTPCFLSHTPWGPLSGLRINVSCDAIIVANVSTENASIRLYRNGSPIESYNAFYAWTTTVVIGTPAFMHSIMDFPFTSSPVLYQVYANITVNGGNGVYVPWTYGAIEIEELML